MINNLFLNILTIIAFMMTVSSLIAVVYNIARKSSSQKPLLDKLEEDKEILKKLDKDKFKEYKQIEVEERSNELINNTKFFVEATKNLQTLDKIAIEIEELRKNIEIEELRMNIILDEGKLKNKKKYKELEIFIDDLIQLYNNLP